MTHQRSARNCLGVIAVLLILPLEQAVHAQVPVRTIPDEVACATCRITVTRIATLGDVDGPGMVGDFGWVWQSPEGGFFVHSGQAQPGAVLVFDAQGTYLRRFGRSGDGPGEYTMPRVFHAVGDTVVVADRMKGRVTTLAGGRVTTLTLPFQLMEALWLGDGRAVFSAPPERAGEDVRPVRVVGLGDGSVLHSLGAPPDQLVGEYVAYFQTLAASRAGGFWTVPINRYGMERWNVEGERTAAVEREAPWFPTWVASDFKGAASDVEPLPELVGVREDAGGLLWTFTRVADAEWAPVEPAESRGGETRTSEIQNQALFDTVIEVLDLDAGVVLARLRRPERIMAISGPDTFYTYEEMGPGHPRFVVWRVALVR